jgi:hypothetical protein
MRHADEIGGLSVTGGFAPPELHIYSNKDTFFST